MIPLQIEYIDYRTTTHLENMLFRFGQSSLINRSNYMRYVSKVVDENSAKQLQIDQLHVPRMLSVLTIKYLLFC